MDKRKYFIFYGLLILIGVRILLMFVSNVDKGISSLITNMLFSVAVLTCLWIIESPANLKDLLCTIQFHELISKSKLVTRQNYPSNFFSLKEIDRNRILKNKSFLISDFYLRNNGEVLIGIISKNKIQSAYKIRIEKHYHDIECIRLVYRARPEGALNYHIYSLDFYKSSDVFQIEEDIIDNESIEVELSLYI